MQQRPGSGGSYKSTYSWWGQNSNKAHSLNGKAPGLNSLPAEIFKHGGSLLQSALHSLYLCCRRASKCLQGCPHSHNLQTKRHQARLRQLPWHLPAIYCWKDHCEVDFDSILPESQCGFRAGRSTIDMVFTLRQLQEKAIEQNMPLFIAFVDFSKAFDSVTRPLLWKILARYGCPGRLISLIRKFHNGMTGWVSVAGSSSDPFTIEHGVKQGCVLAPTLFTIFLSAVMEVVSLVTTGWNFIRTPSDGNLFNLRRLQASTKTQQIHWQERLFADDAAPVAHSEHDLPKPSQQVCQDSLFP